MRGLTARMVLGVVMAVIALTGCASRDLSKPPRINYGRDTCAQCRMIIQDERFAAAVVTPDGAIAKFDDIGCMQAQNKNSAPGSRVWVHDLESGLWLDAQNAEFSKQEDLITPMGSGITAHQRRKSQ